MITKHTAGAILGFVTVLCWSGYNVAAKHGIDAGISPEVLSFLRFAVPGIAAMPLLIVLRLRGKSLGIPVARLLVLVLLGGPLFGLAAVSGYVHAPLSHGLLFAPVTVFVVGSFLGCLLLKERVSTNRLVGAFVMFVGLATLVGFDVGGLGVSWSHGVALFVLAGAMWGGYTVLLRLWRIPIIEGTVAVAAGSALIALPILGPNAWETLPSVSAFGLAVQIVMQGLVGGVIGVAALVGAVRTLPAQVAALLPTFTPVVALAIAAGSFGHIPSAAEASGVAIIAIGFLVSSRPTTMNLSLVLSSSSPQRASGPWRNLWTSRSSRSTQLANDRAVRVECVHTTRPNELK